MTSTEKYDIVIQRKKIFLGKLGRNFVRSSRNSDMLYINGKINRSYKDNFTLVTNQTEVPPLIQNSNYKELIIKSNSPVDTSPKFIIDDYGNISALYLIERALNNSFPWPISFTKNVNTKYGFDQRLYMADTVFSWLSIKGGEYTEFSVSNSQEIFTVRDANICNNVNGTRLNAASIMDKAETGFHAFSTATGEILGGLNVVAYQEPKTLLFQVVVINQQCTLLNSTMLENFLNNIVYNQCVVKFNVILYPNLVQSVYDLDNNEYLNFEQYQDPYVNPNIQKTTTEPQAIIDSCGQIFGNNNYVIFIVPPYIQNAGGYAYLGGRFGFVACSSNQPVFFQTIAHEVGHMIGKLPDFYQSENPNAVLHYDTSNLMGYSVPIGTNTVLRKDQWDQIHKEVAGKWQY